MPGNKASLSLVPRLSLHMNKLQATESWAEPGNEAKFHYFSWPTKCTLRTALCVQTHPPVQEAVPIPDHGEPESVPHRVAGSTVHRCPRELVAQT